MNSKTIKKLTSEKFWKAKSNLNRTKIQRVFDNYYKKFVKAGVSTSFLNGKYVAVNFYVKDKVLESYAEFKFRFTPKNPRETLSFKTEVESVPDVRILYKDNTYNNYDDYEKALRKNITKKIEELNMKLIELEAML